jgi:hypothetical protein
MAGLPNQLAALVQDIVRETVRLTPGVVSLLAHHPAGTLAVSATVLVVVLLVRYAVVLLVVAVAVVLLISAAGLRHTTAKTTGPCQISVPHRSGPAVCPTNGPGHTPALTHALRP